MVTEEGVIERILNQKALVRVQKSSACAHCDSRGACRVIADKEMMIEMANDLHAKVGDHIELSVPGGSIIKLSMLVYLFPIVALIIGAYAGGSWAEFFHIRSTLASILGGGFAMGISFYILKWFDRTAETKGEYHPRMTRILISADTPQASNDPDSP